MSELSDAELRAAAIKIMLSDSCWDVEALSWVIEDKELSALHARGFVESYYDACGFGSYRLNQAGLDFVKGGD